MRLLELALEAARTDRDAPGAHAELRGGQWSSDVLSALRMLESDPWFGGGPDPAEHVFDTDMLAAPVGEDGRPLPLRVAGPRLDREATLSCGTLEELGPAIAAEDWLWKPMAASPSPPRTRVSAGPRVIVDAGVDWPAARSLLRPRWEGSWPSRWALGADRGCEARPGRSQPSSNTHCSPCRRSGPHC